MISIQKDLTLRTIKIVDIGYVTTIYFFVGVLVSRLFDEIFGKHDPNADDKKHILRIAFELIGMIWIVGITAYLVRNFMEFVPFPLNGIYGFEHKKVKELGNASVYIFVVMFFSYHLRAKMEYFYKRTKNET